MRVLYVEDNEQDADLTCRRLARIAPGNAATHSVTTIIQSMPTPISHQKKPSKPNGIATSPSMPAGITIAETTGMAARLASRSRSDRASC